jgi:hypothetical protein
LWRILARRREEGTAVTFKCGRPRELLCVNQI